jgi:DNA repair photolyase
VSQVARVQGFIAGRFDQLRTRLSASGALPPGWRLSDWEVEQGVTFRFASATGEHLEVDLERADPARPCFAHTRDFNVYFSLFGRRGSSLSPSESALLSAVVAAVRALESSHPPLRATLPVLATEPSRSRVEVREVEAERSLVAEAPGMYYLNPYVGCILGCTYCYGIGRTAFVRDLGGLSQAPWGRWIDVRINAPALLAREVLTEAPGTVRMSPLVTDPYQPVERRYRITRQCLEVLRESAFTSIVLTRSPMVLDDVALFQTMPRLLVGLSIPTDDDGVRALFEPAAPPIAQRLEALKALRQAGLRTFVVAHPMLPMNVERLVEAVAPWVDAVRLGPMAEREHIAPTYARGGFPEALTEAWAQETAQRLAAGFARHGVPVNPRTEPWSLFR